MAQYDYSIYNDFPNHKVAPGRLKQEIEAKPEITVALDVPAITTLADVCSIYFKADLDAGQQTALDAVVAAHSGLPLTEEQPVGRTRIIDVSVMDPDTVRTICEGHEVSIEINDEIVEWKKQLDMPEELICGETFLSGDDAAWDYNDKVDFFICPPSPMPGTLPVGTIGVTPAPASSGQPDLQMDAGLVVNLKAGFYLCFGENEKTTKKYRILSVDYTTAIVTLDEDLAADVPAGTPVVLRVYSLINWPIYRAVVQKFAADTPGGAYADKDFWLYLHLRFQNPATMDYVWNFGLTKKY